MDELFGDELLNNIPLPSSKDEDIIVRKSRRRSSVRLLHLVALLALVLVTAPSGAEVSLSKYPKVYKGGEGAVVVVVPLAPQEKKQALIKVTGIDTAIDGQVFLYDLDSEGKAYTMISHGQRHTRLRMDRGSWTRWVTLYLPGQRDGINVGYSEEASKKVRGEDLLDTYLNRRTPAERASTLDVAGLRRREEQLVTAKKTKAESACRATFSVRLDWKTVTEGQLRALKISAYCGHVLDALAKVCADDLGRKAIAKVKRIECRFGKAMRAQLASGLLGWTTNEEGPNQGVYIEDFLLKSL